MKIKIPANEKRTFEQLREQYELEKELAQKLLIALKEERRYLYTQVYDELFQKIPHHPLLNRENDIIFQSKLISQRMRLLHRFLTSETVFLEVGPGDCSLAFEVAKYVKKVYAVDVSKEITKNKKIPSNFELIISDGSSISVPENSINIAFSDQLIEHLHPDDVSDQLKNIYSALVPGGLYLCLTPNRVNGPHDISKYFDEVSTGFHLKEYTIVELSKLFRKAGFSKVITFIGGKGIYLKFPALPLKLCERMLNILSYTIRKKIASTLLFKALLGITIIGIKRR